MISETHGWTLDTPAVSNNSVVVKCIRANKRNTYSVLKTTFDAFITYVRGEDSCSSNDICFSNDETIEPQEGGAGYGFYGMSPTNEIAANLNDPLASVNARKIVPSSNSGSLVISSSPPKKKTIPKKSSSTLVISSTAPKSSQKKKKKRKKKGTKKKKNANELLSQLI